MGMHYVLQGLFVAAGSIAVLAAVFDWEWFFSAHNSQYIVRRAGRRRARLLYGLLGGIFIAVGVVFFIAVRKM
ncbi:immunity protein 10 [Bacteroidetes bacterium oral taxon 272 str. F0290]|nr:immunity protein 10 [Bacteroidetes bacterium oral taxon 272 str. F0290]